MDEKIKAQLRKMLEENPKKAINDVLLYMASVCDSKRLATLGSSESFRWSNRQAALEAIKAVLVEDERG